MKIKNDSKKLFRHLISGAALLLFVALSAANAAAQQEKSKSPCVSLTFTGEHNSPTYKWKNQNDPLCKQAVESLRAASILILGLDTASGSNEYDLKSWFVQIADNAAWNAEFNDGFDFGDASRWLKETRSWTEYQYNKIPQEIYGRPINAQEQTDYRAAVEAKKTWYAPLFLAEKEKLNSNPAERELMITRAYQKVFNRAAGAREMGRWKSGKEIYREIVAQLQKENSPKRG